MLVPSKVETEFEEFDLQVFDSDTGIIYRLLDKKNTHPRLTVWSIHGYENNTFTLRGNAALDFWEHRFWKSTIQDFIRENWKEEWLSR